MANTTRSFVPDIDTATAPAHSHWLVTDGESIPPLAPALPRVRHFARALASPLPTDPILMTVWTDEKIFQEAAWGLLTFFGQEDPSVAVSHKPFNDSAWRHWVLDTQQLSQATGVQWISWEEWVELVEANLEAMKKYTTDAVGSAPDWRRLWWEQGLAARQQYGYRIREIDGLVATSHYEDFVQSLVKWPGRMERADEWARRVSQSALLSELLASGTVTSTGILEHATPWIKDRKPLLEFFGFGADSVRVITGQMQSGKH